jgi:HEPN domain-containing protein
MMQALKEAERWATQAEDDLKFVEWLGREKTFFDKGCFIAQQAGEKMLKACLYGTGKRQVLGHSLVELTAELSRRDLRFKEIEAETRRLDRYYIPTRYPNGLPGGTPYQSFTEEDLTSALKDVKTVFKVARAYLEELGRAAEEELGQDRQD